MFPVRDSLRGPLAYKRRARYLDMTCTQAVAATRFPDSPRRSRRRNLFKNSWAVSSYCTREFRPNVCETVHSFSKTFLAKATERTSVFLWIALICADRWAYWKIAELFTTRGLPVLYKQIVFKRYFLNNYFRSTIICGFTVLFASNATRGRFNGRNQRDSIGIFERRTDL